MGDKKKIFEIDEGSIVKGTGAGKGYLVCTTTPDHKRGMKLKDRKKRYVYYHIALKEQALGKYIDPTTEDVHHRDGDSSNNSLSNLELVKKGPHHSEHALKHKPWKHSPGYKKMMKKREQARKVASMFLTINM